MNIVMIPMRPSIVKRSWKERLFTLPWTPLVATRTEFVNVLPPGKMLRNGDVIYCNPADYKNVQFALTGNYGRFGMTKLPYNSPVSFTEHGEL